MPAPTERSIPPIKMTSVMPTPMITISAICAVRFEKLPAVRKASRVSGWMARPAHSANSTPTMRKLREARISPSTRAEEGGGVGAAANAQLGDARTRQRFDLVRVVAGERQRQVLRDGELEDEPARLAIFRHQREAGGDGRAR